MICIIGITGKMGKAIQKLLKGEVCGFSRINNVKEAFTNVVATSCGVIDFSHADNLQPALEVCVSLNKPYLCGTTNLTKEDMQALLEASKVIPVMYTSNTSLGVAALKKALKVVAKELGPTCDIEITETHHRYKKDAPSGTALALGKVIADAFNWDFNKVIVTDRHTTPRSKDNPQIGFTSIRGGNAIGEHFVHFFYNDEVIRLSHTCFNRQVYAGGAIKAANWLFKQKPGFYAIEDMLR